ncbi:MAG: hypothetical protein AAGC55_03185 [Myxococcota bacterium]
MRTPWDQFHKTLLASLLKLSCRVEVEVEVRSQVQSIDLVAAPDGRPIDHQRLGALGRIFDARRGPCLLECFSTTPTLDDVAACIRKQLVYYQGLVLDAKHNKQDKPAKPALWITSPGHPATVLSAYRATAMGGMPHGFWHTRAVDRLHVIVIDQLPVQPDTLALRLLGRRRTLRRALRELFSLPQAHRIQPLVESAVLALPLKMSHHTPRDVMLAIDELRARYYASLEEARREGQRIGALEGTLEGQRSLLRQQLLQRFGSLPPELENRLALGKSDDLERWAIQILTAPSARAALD